MADTWKVICKSVWIRNAASSNATKLGVLYNGDTIQVTETGGGGYWLHHTKGWSCCKDADGTTVIVKQASTPPATVPPAPTPEKEPTVIDAESGYSPDLNGYLMFDTQYVTDETLTMKYATSILGLPYQFMSSVDRRINDEDPASLGRKYSEKIISRMPLLLLTPGVPVFMARASEEERKSAIETLISHGIGRDRSSYLENLFTRPSRYYTFKMDYDKYYDYVNPLCRMGVSFLGIKNETLDGTNLDRVDWGKITQNKINTFLGFTFRDGAVPFYINSDTQISESFSNSTTESMIANSINSLSDKGREFNFLLGYGGNALGAQIDAFTKDEDISSLMQNIDDLIDELAGGSQILKNLNSHLLTIASGGKLIFPEIWSSSEFSRSYDINIKLTTPDNDKLSWFFNIWVPLAHIICLAAPRNVDGNPNGYTSPFLIRGFYKGLFTCDMGIISSLSITKGAEGAWTRDGLPTQVEVNMTIKDLYDTMSITEMTKLDDYDTMNNTALMTYIANSCGVNIHEPDIIRDVKMWITQNYQSKIVDNITKNIWGTLEVKIQNTIKNVYNSFFYG